MFNSASFLPPSTPPPLSHLRTRFAPYFKRHISKDHASSTGKMSMLAAGLPPLHHTGWPPPRRIVSPCQLATNYTLMRRRVIRRRCAKRKGVGDRREISRDDLLPPTIYISQLTYFRRRRNDSIRMER